MQRSRIVLSCITLIGLVCLGAFVTQIWLRPEPIQSVTDTGPEHGPALNNAAATTTTPPAPTIEIERFETSAPETVQKDDSGSESDADLASSEAAHPAMELTDFRGEMKTAKLASRPTVDLASHPSLPWFTTDAASIAFPKTAESADRDYFYAWVQLNPNHLHTIDSSTFNGHQVDILDGWTEYRRARLPRSTDLLAQLLEHEAVLALGNKPISEKIGTNFREEIDTSSAAEATDVFITLMTAEQLPHWRQEIEGTGAVIDHWDPTIRVLVASVPYGKLLELAEWDFVQAVEPVGTSEPLLDSSIPTSGADGVRTHLSINGTFSGLTGENITIGVMDTGLNLAHPDIFESRDSICGKSFQTLIGGNLDTDDLWVDYSGHGTHVTSIWAGTGIEDRSRAGIAPGVKHIRFAKAFGKDVIGASNAAIIKAMDWFTEETSCEWNGAQSVAKTAQVVNMSLGSATSDAGYATGAKKLDWAVWNHDQVYVVAQGNARYAGYSAFASAKNSIAAAWLTDTMFSSISSSFGPTSDGRLKPNVGMSGDRVYAADGDGTTGGYVPKGGTSMSSPATAGVATLLMSTDEGFETNPALVRAQLMATAIKADAFFHDEIMAGRNNSNGVGYINTQHGIGSVSARLALTQGPDGAWSSHSAVSEIDNDEYAYIEIDVPENTDRLDIVLTWDEPPNDNVGSAVMADLDLYLGPDDDCDVTDCAEFVSSSRVDNLEFLFIANPEPGMKRITVIPHNIFQFAPRIAVSWMFIEKSTPELNVELRADSVNASNVRRPQIDLTVSADEFVAAGVSLYFACREQNDGDCAYWNDTTNGRWQPGSRVMREDGTFQDLTGVYMADPVILGEVVAGETQEVRLVFPPSMKTRSHQLYASVASSNALSDTDGLDVIIDSQDLPPQVDPIMNKYAMNAMEITGESGTVTIDLAGGARQPGELGIDTDVLFKFFADRGWSVWPFINFTEGLQQSRSAWYKISVEKASKIGIQVMSKEPSNVNLTFQLLAADGMFRPPLAHLWTGDQFEFFLEPDTDYYLRVNTYSPLRPPKVDFVWQKLDTKPVNDNFTDRIELTGETGEFSGNNAFATVESDEPGTHISVGSTWFKWIAPADGVWKFRSSAPYSNLPPQIYVYQGDTIGNLRMLSDPTFFDADVPVVAGQEYQVCVSSDADFTDFQGAYELSWEEATDDDLLPNDLFANAESISGESGSQSKCDSCLAGDRTIEMDEPTSTNSHSLWWSWEAPSTGNFTFRMRNMQYDELSVFSGSELSNLTLLATGPEFVVSVTADETYYIAVHRSSGLEYMWNVSGNTFEWGATPENDRISAPTTLAGTSGSVTMALKYATTTSDELRANGITSAGVRSSVWGLWTAPSDYDGWMLFSTERWDDLGLTASDQVFLGIHEHDAANDSWTRVASTDRSYIISGRPHAIFKPIAGRQYRVQVALRANNRTVSATQAEVEIYWEETETPAWISSDMHFYEVGSPSGNNIEELIDPTGGTVAGDNLDRLVLAVEDEMVVLDLSAGDQDLSVLETIPYQDGDGQTVANPHPRVFTWHAPRQAIYAPLNDGFALLEGLQQSSRAFTKCEVHDDFDIAPQELVAEGTGQFLYKISSGTISAYRIDGPCELTIGQVITSVSEFHQHRIQVPEMAGLRSAVFSRDQSHLYGFSNDRIFTFHKDGATGILSIVSNTEHSVWQSAVGIDGNSNRFDAARVAIDPSGNYMFAVASSNPAVAIFDITTDPENPTPLAALDSYYMPDAYWTFFPTHIRQRAFWDYGFCRIKDVHNTSNPTVEVFCRYTNYVVTFDVDSGEFYISDWSADVQPDRFGNQLPPLFRMLESFGVSTADGKFSYLVVDDWLDSIHRFERITGANPVTSAVSFPLYDDYLIRLVAMDVESNEIELGSQTISTCQAISETEIDDVTYTVLNSKWQVREAVGEVWTDVADTVRTDNQLCPYDPTDTRDYRLVFEATVDGVTGKYSSDVLAEVATESN